MQITGPALLLNALFVFEALIAGIFSFERNMMGLITILLFLLVAVVSSRILFCPSLFYQFVVMGNAVRYLLSIPKVAGEGLVQPSNNSQCSVIGPEDENLYFELSSVASPQQSFSSSSNANLVIYPDTPPWLHYWTCKWDSDDTSLCNGLLCERKLLDFILQMDYADEEFFDSLRLSTAYGPYSLMTHIPPAEYSLCYGLLCDKKLLYFILQMGSKDEYFFYKPPALSTAYGPFCLIIYVEPEQNKTRFYLFVLLGMLYLIDVAEFLAIILKREEGLKPPYALESDSEAEQDVTPIVERLDHYAQRKRPVKEPSMSPEECRSRIHERFDLSTMSSKDLRKHLLAVNVPCKRKNHSALENLFLFYSENILLGIPRKLKSKHSFPVNDSL